MIRGSGQTCTAVIRRRDPARHRRHSFPFSFLSLRKTDLFFRGTRARARTLRPLDWAARTDETRGISATLSEGRHPQPLSGFHPGARDLAADGEVAAERHVLLADSDDSDDDDDGPIAGLAESQPSSWPIPRMRRSRSG